MDLPAWLTRSPDRLDRREHRGNRGRGAPVSVTRARGARDTAGPVPAAVEVSIVVPCLNEEVTVGEFVDWCFEGLASAGVSGEVVIVDSSSDRSPEIASEHGARVISVPKRGLGRAYIDALPHVRG